GGRRGSLARHAHFPDRGSVRAVPAGSGLPGGLGTVSGPTPGAARVSAAAGRSLTPTRGSEGAVESRRLRCGRGADRLNGTFRFATHRRRHHGSRPVAADACFRPAGLRRGPRRTGGKGRRSAIADLVVAA